MTINPVTDLHEGEVERLVYLMEECSEVIRAASKILRHGYARSPRPDHPEDKTNREHLENELRDLACALQRMVDARDVDYDAITNTIASKMIESSKWFHFQQPYTDDPISFWKRGETK